MAEAVGQRDHADVVGDAAQRPRLMRDFRSLREHAFDARLARLAALHHSQQDVRAGRGEQVLTPDVDQQFRHVVRRGRVPRVFHLRAPACMCSPFGILL